MIVMNLIDSVIISNENEEEKQGEQSVIYIPKYSVIFVN